MGKHARFVLLSLGKELRETLRDRRTLAIMILVPLVLYPMLALVGTQVMAKRSEEQESRPSAVAVEGAGPAADDLRARLDGKRKLFARKPAGLPADVDSGALDALVLVQGTPNARVPAEIVFDSTRDEGRKAEQRLSDELTAMWPANCAPRFEIDRRDTAPKQKLGGYVLSQALPLMIVLMVLLGAFYPAIDVTAGERERGTLETVLVAPIPRGDLLLGKVLAVTLLASASGFLNLGSMSLTLVQVVNLAAPDADLPVPFARAAASGLVILPTAFLLAAVFVAIGSLARGFKEAQNLLMPVYFLLFIPTMLGALGNLTLGPGLALVPGLNVSLLARDIVLGKASFGLTVLVLGATLGWGLLALAAARRLYVSERFLAARDEADRPPAGRWRDDPPTPGEALALFSIGLSMLYFVFLPLQRDHLVRGLMISQWLGLGGLSVAFILVTRRRLSAAVGRSLPNARALAGATLIGLAAWMVANLVSQWLVPTPKEYVEAFRKLLFPADAQRTLAQNLFFFALTPALCEELLFRGLILRGLATRLRPGSAIAASAAMFAAFHIDVYRLLPTFLLGLLLGFVAHRGRSFLASALMHFLNNGIVVVLGAQSLDQSLDRLGMASKLGMLVGAAALVGGGILVLLRNPPEPVAAADRQM